VKPNCRPPSFLCLNCRPMSTCLIRRRPSWIRTIVIWASEIQPRKMIHIPSMVPSCTCIAKAKARVLSRSWGRLKSPSKIRVGSTRSTPLPTTQISSRQARTAFTTNFKGSTSQATNSSLRVVPCTRFTRTRRLQARPRRDTSIFRRF